MSDIKWAKREILLLAADELPRRALERALTDHGYEPRLASNHADALALADEHSFALGVIDANDVSLELAMELTRRLLAGNPTAHAIIIHDWKSDQEHLSKTSDQIRMLYRPFSMLEFISSVDDALSIGR